ncbi:MAG: hypothetical protein ABEJ82_00360 [Haloplanus sp.]
MTRTETWAALFERGARHEVTVGDVTAALRRRRASADGTESEDATDG